MPNKDDNAVPAGGVDPALAIAVVDLADAGYTARAILAMSSVQTVINAAQELRTGLLPPVDTRRVAFNPALAAPYGVDPVSPRDAAAEGTVAHAIGEQWLKTGVHISADFPGGPVDEFTDHVLADVAQAVGLRPEQLRSPFPGVDQDGEPIGSEDPFVELGYSLPEDGHPRTRKTSNPKAKTRDHELHMKTVKELAQLDIGFFMHIDEKAGKAMLRRPNCQTVIFLTHKSRWMLAGRNKTTHGTVAEFATWYRNNIGVS